MYFFFEGEGEIFMWNKRRKKFHARNTKISGKSESFLCETVKQKKEIQAVFAAEQETENMQYVLGWEGKYVKLWDSELFLVSGIHQVC